MELRQIYEECGGDLVKVADRLQIPYAEFVRDYATQLAAPPAPTPRRRIPPSDLGQLSLRRYIISVRHADNPHWPRDDQRKIDDGRLKYEAGTHEMCQGRDRNWFILYLIPRKNRVGARKFFQIFGD